MKRNFTLMTMVIALCLFVGKANAAFIVDTGTPPSAGGFGLSSLQWLANEFTLLSPAHTITDIEGYISHGVAQTATVAIYSDGGEVPGSELFSQQFSVPASSSISWSGPSGLSWTLYPGTYWVAFEVREGDSLVGSMPSPPPSTLGNYAYWSSSSGSWSESDNLALGIRIQGDPVPIPGAVWLLGSGIIGLFGIRRKFQRLTS